MVWAKKWFGQNMGLARPSRHFVVLEDSESGKVQKVGPKGINKGRLPWSTEITIFTD